MRQKFVLALDQGTTSSRALIFGHRGRVVAKAQQEFPQHFPQPGWVEHDPADLWETTRRTALAAVAEANLTGAHLAALGLTNQRETTLLWDRATGRPLHRAIVWQDRRTAALCAKLKKRGLEPLFREKTGLLLDPYFSGTKLAWLLDHLPGARRRAARGELAFGTVDTWLLWQLTGGKVHATDVSNASRTLLLNLHTGEWDADLLKLLRIPREVLPAVRSSSEIYGHVETIPALNGVPIAGIAGDQQAALFGQACFRPGHAKNTYGTGCFLLLHTGQKPVVSKHQLLTTVAWRLGPDAPLEYALEGSVFIGGATVNAALMQFQADLLRVPVIRPRVTETTALGAAYLAGLAIGFWKNRAEIAAQWAESCRFRPAPNRAAMKKLQSTWHRAVARAKDWA